MRIIASSISKRYDNLWIFRELYLDFKSNTSYAITGSNGSGKSTLLLALCNFVLLSEGKVLWMNDEQTIDEQKYYRYFSLVSPHVEIPMELTVQEFLRLQAYFAGMRHSHDVVAHILQDGFLEPYATHYIHQLSSGTKARLKLCMAFYFPKPIVLLDEFSIFLDEKATAWAFHHVQKMKQNRLLIISTNDEQESRLCDEQIVLCQ